MIPKQTLSKWNRDLARAVAALGSDQFFPAMVAAIQGQVRFDHPQVWLYHSDLPPRSLYNEVPEQALDVARKKDLSGDCITHHLKHPNDQQDFTKAAGCGLCLRKIVYKGDE